MPAPGSSPPPRSGLTPLTATIITLALIGGWCVMWFAGLFQSLGTRLALVVLSGDVAAIAVIWFITLRRDLNRRD